MWEPLWGRTRVTTCMRAGAAGLLAAITVVVALAVGAMPASAASAPTGAQLAAVHVSSVSARAGLLTLVAAFVVGTLSFYVAGVALRQRQRAKGAHRKPRREHSPAPW